MRQRFFLLLENKMETTRQSTYTDAHRRYYAANREAILEVARANGKVYYAANAQRLKRAALQRYHRLAQQARDSPGGEQASST